MAAVSTNPADEGTSKQMSTIVSSPSSAAASPLSSDSGIISNVGSPLLSPCSNSAIAVEDPLDAAAFDSLLKEEAIKDLMSYSSPGGRDLCDFGFDVSMDDATQDFFEDFDVGLDSLDYDPLPSVDDVHPLAVRVQKEPDGCVKTYSRLQDDSNVARDQHHDPKQPMREFVQ